MKKQLLTLVALATGVAVNAQIQLNTLTNFSDFAITTPTSNPIVMAGTTPVSVTGTNCATGFFQKLFSAGQMCDSIVATFQVKTNAGSTITSYGQAVPAGPSARKIKVTSVLQLNVGYSLQFCGTNDTISFTNLLVLAYPAQNVGIAENSGELAKNIYSANKTLVIKNMELKGLFIAIYDLDARLVYSGAASEKTELGTGGVYLVKLQDKDKNVIAVKKVYAE